MMTLTNWFRLVRDISTHFLLLLRSSFHNLCCRLPAMSQQCWRPPSPMAAGLPSGWRCPPVGPVWSSTSGCCWVLCAAVRTSQDHGAHASNVAQHPLATSVLVSDGFYECPGSKKHRSDDSELPVVPCRWTFFTRGHYWVQGSRTHSGVRRNSSALGALSIYEELALKSQAWHPELQPLTRTWQWFQNTFTEWIAKGVRRSGFLHSVWCGETVRRHQDGHISDFLILVFFFIFIFAIFRLLML